MNNDPSDLAVVQFNPAFLDSEGPVDFASETFTPQKSEPMYDRYIKNSRGPVKKSSQKVIKNDENRKLFLEYLKYLARENDDLDMSALDADAFPSGNVSYNA